MYEVLLYHNWGRILEEGRFIKMMMTFCQPNDRFWLIS